MYRRTFLGTALAAPASPPLLEIGPPKDFLPTFQPGWRLRPCRSLGYLDRTGKVAWEPSFGVKNADTKQPVDNKTL